MNKPLLLVVTGSPASGKTTLAHILANEINCPLVSRDALKEGLLNTLHVAHNDLPEPVDLQVYETFFETIDLLLSKSISLVIEAAYQNKLWKPKLERLLDKANVIVIICKTNLAQIKARFAARLEQNPSREKYHGDQLVENSVEQFAALVENYEPVTINAPTLHVDTAENYQPRIDEIVQFIHQARFNG